MVKKYIPKKLDIIYTNFSPQAGKEQAGRRPALVISSTEYNKISGLVLIMPITSKVKNFPFEVPLANNLKTKGVILTDHIKCIDWKTRKAKFIEETDIETYLKAIYKLDVLIDS